VSKYTTSPQKAYAKGGFSSGPLVYVHPQPCLTCGERLVAYSSAGQKEWSMSGMCEPCFDFATWPRSEPCPEWMRLVEYHPDFVPTHNRKDNQ
jgi:hypothetical protein